MALDATCAAVTAVATVLLLPEATREKTINVAEAVDVGRWVDASLPRLLELPRVAPEVPLAPRPRGEGEGAEGASHAP